MAQPYEFGPVEFDAEGGMPTVIELKLPHYGAISVIRLIPLDGVFVGGTFRIFTKREAALDVAGSSSSASLPGLDPDLYSVCGRKTFTVDGYEEYDGNYPYQNKDGTYSVPIRRLWLVMQPDGSGAKTYGLSMVLDQSHAF